VNILRFEMNVPNRVALESPHGTFVEGRYGDRVMYRLVGGRVMYVPPIVKARIEAQGIIPGEPFELCKTQSRDGRRRLIEWHLNRVESGNGQGAAKSTMPAVPNSNPPPPETQLEADLRGSLDAVYERHDRPRDPVATCDPSARPDTQRAEPTGSAHGPATQQQNRQVAPLPAEMGPQHPNGAKPERTIEKIDEDPEKTPSGAATPSPAAPNPTTSNPTTKLEHALKTAISAAHNAEKFGSELGYVVRFDADAIKSMAITVLINMAQGARR